MRRLKGLLHGVWEFVVGDDWRIAAGVVLGLAVTALVSDTSLSAWWILPLIVVALLGFSVWRATAASR
jgi:hypothetical protein